MSNKSTALTLAVGSAFAASLVSIQPAAADDNPFKMQSLESGYQVAAADKDKEGKCGEGKCGGDKKKEGACGGDNNKKKEGKCGEGKCGGNQ